MVAPGLSRAMTPSMFQSRWSGLKAIPRGAKNAVFLEGSDDVTGTVGGKLKFAGITPMTV